MFVEIAIAVVALGNWRQLVAGERFLILVKEELRDCRGFLGNHVGACIVN